MCVTSTPSACASRAVARCPVEPTPGMTHPRRILLHPRDQLRQRVGFEGLAPDQHQRIGVDHGDRQEILLGVERQRLVERHVGRDLQIVDEQGVAVGRRARDALAGDVGAAAADVLDDEVLAELGRELRADLPRHLVGRAARRIGHDDGDRPRRIGLRVCDGDASECCERDRENMSFHLFSQSRNLSFVAPTIAHNFPPSFRGASAACHWAALRADPLGEPRNDSEEKDGDARC